MYSTTLEEARRRGRTTEDKSIPSCLDVVAKTDDNEVMAVAHKEYEIYGG